MYGLLIGEDATVAAWTFHTFNLFPTHVNLAIGIVNTKTGKLCGAALFQSFNGYNVEISYYRQKTLSAGIIRSLARIALAEFSASRVTAVTSKRRRRLMKAMSRLGFRIEGIQRCYYGPADNVRNTGVRFVMFKPRLQELASFTIGKEGVAQC